MPTLLIFHEVDDVDHWVNSPRRAEEFAKIGATVREFTDPQGSNRIGIIAEVPDMAALDEMMKSDATADAMKHDGVRPETLLVLSEA